MITFAHLGHYGRLGNQMFQYALLLGIAAKTNYTIGIPYRNKEKTVGRFNPVIGEFDSVYLDLFNAFQNISAKDIGPAEEIAHYNQYIERSYEFDPGVFNQPDNTNYHGYFQSESYFEHAKDIVRHEFTIREEFSSIASSMINKFKDSNRPIVSIHVRRGDSLPDNRQFVSFGTPEYFQRAKDRLGLENAIYLIFSDDLRWCYDNMGDQNHHIIDNTTLHNSHIIDLAMISQCDHNILVSSSFGWWGAWLNQNTNKQVICPDIWWGTANRHLAEEWVRPKEWITVQTY